MWWWCCLNLWRHLSLWCVSLTDLLTVALGHHSWCCGEKNAHLQNELWDHVHEGFWCCDVQMDKNMQMCSLLRPGNRQKQICLDFIQTVVWSTDGYGSMKAFYFPLTIKVSWINRIINFVHLGKRLSWQQPAANQVGFKDFVDFDKLP